MNRTHFGAAILAALGVVAATVAGGALHTTSHPHVTAGDDAGVLFADSITPFDPRPGPRPQIDWITVYDRSPLGQGQSVPVTGATVQVDTAGVPADPWRILQEDCTRATIAPQGYCVVGLWFNGVTVPPNAFEVDGEVDLTLGDGSVFRQGITTSQETAGETLPTNPLQIDYGDVMVATTTAPRTVTMHAPQFSSMVMSVSTVPQPGQPDAAGDYHTSTDNCTGTTLNPQNFPNPTDSCTVGVAATPAAAGNRPAFLDTAFCFTDSFPKSDPGNDTGNPVPPPGVPPGQELVCGQGDGRPNIAQHVLVALAANGITPASPPPPGQTFTPTLIALPAVAPAGRTTMITGTGFPDDTTVTLALVPQGTPTTTNPATVVGSVSVTTNGIGGFTNQLMLIMPHTTPGQYEILGAAGTVTATVPFLVAPGTQEPPKFVTRH